MQHSALRVYRYMHPMGIIISAGKTQSLFHDQFIDLRFEIIFFCCLNLLYFNLIDISYKASKRNKSKQKKVGNEHNNQKTEKRK